MSDHTKITPHTTKRIGYRPAEVLQLIPISRNKLYADLAAGAIPSRRIGKTIIIPCSWVDSFGAA
jgi:hypothetical protein